ncbi:MAG: hypothetical protein LBD23_09740, partial [Oscillospiraceae bacterium]|nr:hypothetical protein [Oscillospiraceae bacterium]
KYYYFKQNNSLSHSPFTPSQLDFVEACIDRYEYLTNKYLDEELEAYCRRWIFIAMIESINLALRNHVVDIYHEDIQKTIEQVKKYNIYDCALTPAQEKIIKLIFNDFVKYVLVKKMMLTKQESD